MKIALDVMGFENKTSEAIKAARKFSAKFPGTKIVLVGNEQDIKSCLSEKDNFKFVFTTEVINMSDTPLQH